MEEKTNTTSTLEEDKKPKPSKKQNTIIIMSVDTVGLTSGKKTKDQAINFTDNRGDTLTGNLEGFTSIVNKGETVFWSAVGENNIGNVNITNIEEISDPNTNDKKILHNVGPTSANNKNNFQYEAKVKTEGVAYGDQDKYTITFKVEGDPTEKPYIIDPKLKIPIGG